jgi:hypothetical protein
VGSGAGQRPSAGAAAGGPGDRADRAAGYRYDISILQAEFSLTQMLDKPVSGRIFFEQVIRDNPSLGRPDRISLIFGRSIYRGRKNHTPGTFATRVVTDGVTPSLHVLCKHAQIKQYHNCDMRSHVVSGYVDGRFGSMSKT